MVPQRNKSETIEPELMNFRLPMRRKSDIRRDTKRSSKSINHFEIVNRLTPAIPLNMYCTYT